MTRKIDITWKIEATGTYDRRGNKLCRVYECYSGFDADDRVFGPFPGKVSDAFVRARREWVNKHMTRIGFTPKPSIDWSFLDKGPIS